MKFDPRRFIRLPSGLIVPKRPGLTRRALLSGIAASILAPSAGASLQINQLNGFNVGGRRASEISLVGTASNSTTNGGNVVVSFPGGVLEDDVAYLVYVTGGTGDVNLGLTSGGWSELSDLYGNGTTNDTNMGVYRKVMGVSPDSSVTCTGVGFGASGAAAALMVLRGVDTSTPEDVAVTTMSAGNNGIPDPPSITTATNGAWVLACGASSVNAVPTAPTNYLDLVHDQGNDTNDANAMIARRLITSAGIEDPDIFGNLNGGAGDSRCAVTIAVRPAS